MLFAASRLEGKTTSYGTRRVFRRKLKMQNHEGKLLPLCFNSSLPFVIPNDT